MPLPTFIRRHALAILGSALLVACSGGGETAALDLKDMTMGSPDAPVEMIEYASSVCPACANYDATMKETIVQLVEDGKLHYVFREFPRDAVDTAGFVTARCAGDDKYFDVLSDLFKNQRGILAAAQNGSAGVALQAIAARHGVDKAQFEACLQDEELKDYVANAALAGYQADVSATPTIFLNGIKLGNGEARTPEDLIKLVEERQAG